MSQADRDAEKWLENHMRHEHRERMAFKFCGTYNQFHPDYPNGVAKVAEPTKTLHRVTVEVPAVYEVLVEAANEEEAAALALKKPLSEFDSCGENGGQFHHLHTEKAA